MSVNWITPTLLGEEKMWVCAQEGARVLLADGCTGALKYWPVPKNHPLAVAGIAVRGKRGTRARVVLKSGTWLGVKRSDIVGVDFDTREEEWTKERFPPEPTSRESLPGSTG